MGRGKKQNKQCNKFNVSINEEEIFDKEASYKLVSFFSSNIILECDFMLFSYYLCGLKNKKSSDIMTEVVRKDKK